MSSLITQPLRSLQRVSGLPAQSRKIAVKTSARQTFHYTTTARAMAAAQPAAASQVISETAKQEGGPHKGSTSAQMQSEVVKTRNFEQAAQEVGSKMMNAPETVTSEVSCSRDLSSHNP